MDLQRGLPLLFQQYKALFQKNFLLAKRNKKSTLVQLFAPFIFVFLLFCIQKGSKRNHAEVTDPKAAVSFPIPPCERKAHIRKPCFDFVWSGNGSATINTIVTAIMNNNPGRQIPLNKVKAFRTQDDVDAWLLSNPRRCPGALHFVVRNKTVISYGVQTNLTSITNREDRTFKFQIPLQLAAEREIARSLIGDPNFSWIVGLKEFAHPRMEFSSSLDAMIPPFFLAAVMFGFVFQMGSLVTEKELKLRQAMTMMGLYDSAYWLSWLTWEGILTTLSSLLTVLFGMLFRFDIFLKNSFAVVFLLFFLFQINMSSSTTTMGFSIFVIGFITQALNMFKDASSQPEGVGISWDRRADCPPDSSDCVMTIDGIYKWLASTFFLWFVLAIYFDNIIPNSSGLRKPLFYFLNPSYWTGKGENKVKEGNICRCIGLEPLPELITPDDEDVLEEENLVKQQAREGIDDPNAAVQIHGLIKTYPKTIKIGCCRCKQTPPYHAINGLWVNFRKDQLFCLLGPNGAGKTTTINCLTGISPVTGGDATIYGHSVRNSVGMSNIRKLIGVCPQFDILWDALSGQEHLYLFASIKGLPPNYIEWIAHKLLDEVRLAESANGRAGSYSGGMKRRLSFAIALIGDPKLVILDEPTTGMDPISRRHVWDIIKDAKRGRAIVLTTHSMEEADVLSDRIGIMAKGRLRCIGTSIRLKSKFGTGFIANVSFSRSDVGQAFPLEDIITETHEAVKQFFKYNLNIEPKVENEAFLTFVIPHDRESLLRKFFKDLEERKREFGITDIQIGLTTLNEVFLNIAKKAELESAIAEGRLTTLTLTSGTSFQILIGAQLVRIPESESAENPTGLMVEVYWDQDDAGNLRISGHSDEMPIPPGAQAMASSSNSNTDSGQTGPIQAIVIDPSFLNRHD
ncbi:ABC transporter A family member 2-like isoform X5 [Quercus lobata]|uniref:ABC transporter A family member 2-like isoform X5 n=1 Tax=Quercus lobata TaxID=97700 RepID=UPI0012451744|nr:ABC transporter A family member 2-like isoform X5 [Quercus lobata]